MIRSGAAAIASLTLLVGCASSPAPSPAPAAAALPVAKAQPPTTPTRYVRSERKDGRTALFTGSCAYRSDDGAPVVQLVGVVHIGDKAYYERLAEHLGRFDLVLYESVLPRGAFGASGRDELERQHATQDTMLFLRSLARRFTDSLGTAPANLDELRAWTVSEDSRLARPFDLATVDAWGRAVAYEREGERGYRLVSLGADGRTGGRRFDRDLVLRPMPVAAAPAATEQSAEKKPPKRDLYLDMAEALDVSLQVRSMQYDRAGWMPADMSMEDMLDRLWSRGERSWTLEMLSKPSGFQQGLIRFLLSFVSKSPAFKRTVIESLAGDSADGSRLGGMGEVEERLIIDERNDAVLDRLEAILAQPSPPKSIAIFYGAGHMADFERKLAERFGYLPDEPEWFETMSADEWTQKRVAARIQTLERNRPKLVESKGESSDEVRAVDRDIAALRRRLKPAE